jgi:hypothetical protein
MERIKENLVISAGGLNLIFKEPNRPGGGRRESAGPPLPSGGGSWPGWHGVLERSCGRSWERVIAPRLLPFHEASMSRADSGEFHRAGLGPQSPAL